MVDSILKTTLGNGLRVVTEPIVGSRSASIGAWFAVGSRDETPERSGVSHFLEHLLFKGTEDRSARSVAESIDGVGGDMNAFTAREHTAFYARVPSSSRDMAADVLFDVLRRPALRSSDVDAERMVINEELVAAYDTPDDVVHIALYEALFPGHELGREVLGDPHTIDDMTSQHIADFHDRWYQPANLVIAAAGDIDHDALVSMAEKHFADLALGKAPSRAAPAPAESVVITTELPVEQLHVALGWRGLPHGDPRRYALAMANQILGGSPSSRLFQSIREDQALAYTVFSQTSGYSDAGSAS
ncbi:MAG: putative Zn-dependent peptidase, partial [Verrucomicrobiales bacterium]